MEKDMVEANSLGTMVKLLKGNGKVERKMDMESGNHPKETITKVNGLTIDKMEKDIIIT